MSSSCRATVCYLLIGLSFRVGAAWGAEGPVVLSEMVADASEYLLRDDGSGKLVVGWGPAWNEISFRPIGWRSGSGPFGFGHLGLGTDVGEEMRTATPSLYVRREFRVAAEDAGEAGELILEVGYEDGVVVYLNGREVFRRNLGPPRAFVFADQPVYNVRGWVTNETIRLPAGAASLRAGFNVLGVQVHNTWPIADCFPFDPSLFLSVRLARAGDPPAALVEDSDRWDYFVGHVEPAGGLFDPALLEAEPGLAEFSDWVELHNASSNDVNLAGWSLTDDDSDPRRWIFPSVTIPAGGYLVVFCSGLDRSDPAQGCLHTNFKLDVEGEYLGLFQPSGWPADEWAMVYPGQDAFHSYGLDPGSGRHVYFAMPTPGRPNAGESFVGIVERPGISPAAGFYEESGLAVTLSSRTTGVTIRYTLDGVEPSEVAGAVYGGAIWLQTNAVVRARAFRPGWVRSRVATATFFIQQPPALRSLPVVSLGGDPRRAFHTPEGVTAIVGGHHPGDGIWQPLGPDDYNLALMYGRAFERPISAEFFFPDARGRHQVDAGLRLACSRWSRPHMLMNDLETTIWTNGWQNKPSFALFFRPEHGGSLELPLFPDSALGSFEHLRLRAGKNDWANPFIRDEAVRRLFLRMGQKTSHGLLCNLFVNGEFKSYFNLVERLREPFYQHYYASTNRWDVRHVDETLEGDSVRWMEDYSFIRTGSFAEPAAYDEATRRFDLVNLVDYLLVNIYSAMWDWPENNFYIARERVPAGRWRFSVWDAEGVFGLFVGRSADYDMLANHLTWSAHEPTSPYATIPVIFNALRVNPEFRLLFADRMQEHLFGDGALTEGCVLSNYFVLKAEFGPIVGYVRNEPVIDEYLTNWTSQRTPFVLEHCRALGLWPETRAPECSSAGGEIEPGVGVTLVNPNPGGTIYFTLDGTDPRQAGGLAAGQVYEGPIVLSGSATLQARVLQGTEWSPLITAAFVQPSPRDLAITEIHYEPLAGAVQGGSSYEFVEIKNLGDDPAWLGEVAFVDGIEFTFAPGAVLGPQGVLVLVSDMAAFQERYPGVAVAGVYSGKLDNGGEQLTLAHRATNILFAVRYDNNPPWPFLAAGLGHSLVPRQPTAEEPDDPNYWRASAFLHGSPGADDPEAGVAGVVINEILARPDIAGQWRIELHNSSSNAVDLAGWTMTTSPTLPGLIRFPNGISMPPGGFLVLDPATVSGWNPSPLFSVSPRGGQLVLQSGDPQGIQSGYAHIAVYPASPAGLSVGRWLDSLGREHFPPQSTPTLGLPNAQPWVGPIVVNEFCFRPSPDDFEFVELVNQGPDPMPLVHPASGLPAWLEGLHVSFPSNLVLAPGQFLLLTAVAPEIFRTRHDPGPDTLVVGPWQGHLDNDGERLELFYPEMFGPDPGSGIGYLVFDEVDYEDGSPWPGLPALGGHSLQRRTPARFGNDPGQWFAAPPTPGQANRTETEAPLTVFLALTNRLLHIPLGEEVGLFGSVRQAAEPIEAMTFFANTEFLGEDVAPPYEWVWLAPVPGSYDLQAVARFASGSSATSSPVHVGILNRIWIGAEPMVEPWVIEPPRGVTVPAGGTAVLSVSALGWPLLCQWYGEGDTPLPQATNTILVLEGIDLDQAGDYYVVLSNALGVVTSALARVDVLLLDTDQDGMPDQWERRCGLDPWQGDDAEQDSDSDGFENRDEYVLGRNPLESDLRIELKTVWHEGQTTVLLLRFLVAPRKSATLEYRADCAEGTWLPLVSYAPRPSAQAVKELLRHSETGGFYRVRVD